MRKKLELEIPVNLYLSIYFFQRDNTCCLHPQLFVIDMNERWLNISCHFTKQSYLVIKV